MSVSLLLTAFEPFGGSRVNASQEAAIRLAALPGTRLATLPVTAGDAERAALRALCRLTAAGSVPDLMLSLGEAGPERVVRLEKVAVNWDDFRLRDNAGGQPRDVAIHPAGQDARFATLPVARIARDLEGRTPLPVQVSLSAGAFLCNHLAYAVLEAMARGDVPAIPYLFIHVPSWRPDGPEGEQGLQDLVATLGAVVAEARKALPKRGTITP
ncbi:MAG TPA: hypothetical protein VM490_00740 [Armatimonadaceae bacterium]|nr:hypothetical protein [Armatimonadaceae bacterium]